MFANEMNMAETNASNKINSIDATTSDRSEFAFGTQTTSGLTSAMQLVDHTPGEMFIINQSTAGATITVNFNEEYLKEETMRMIERIVGRIKNEDTVFNGINAEKLIRSLEKSLNNIPIQQVPFNEFELETRIKKIMVLELMSGLLDELTPEQLEAFEESMSRG
ncbi:MAG: hypothetical protein GYA36_21315 [Veillonellaceae bacterium]|nr:hypothetical protein [Veillonellaceae bacterium]